MAEMTLKEYALYYAGIGLAVFPLVPRSKKPATATGCKAATTNQEQITAWWDKTPEFNIGIATGAASGGLVVIDLDVDKDKGIDGYEVLKEWQRENGELPETSMSITGRGGYHYFYRDAAQWRNRAGLYEGVDIRGDGGYVVAPPSIHPNGRRYEWEQEPLVYGFTEVDSLVSKFLVPSAPNKEKSIFQMPGQIPEGQRTSSMIQLVGSLRAKGLDDEAVKAAVQAENEKKCVPPLTLQELEKTVFPALNRGWHVEKPYTAVLDEGRFRKIKQKRTVSYTEADALMKADLPPIVNLVDGLLTKGLGGLSAKSKLGKSWLALQLAVDLSCGSDFLGFSTSKCGVLYIDLENTPSLTQDRLRQVLDGRDVPKNLYFTHEYNLMEEGFEEDLTEFLENHPDVKFVVIDVFQKVKRGKQPNQTDYEADYEILTVLKSIADKYEGCIMPIYHDRKFVDPTDPFSNLLGSTAIIGVSDFVWVLFKEHREDKEATLSVTGRTIQEASFKLKREGVKWVNLGNAAALEETRKRQEYSRDPVVNTIKKLVSQNDGKWKGRVKEIIESSQYFKGCRIYGTSQKVGNLLRNRIEDMQNYDGIYHSEISKGTGGVIHVFETEKPFEKDWS